MGEAVHIPLWRFYSGGRSAWGILSGAIGAPPNFLTAWIAWSIEEESAPIFRLGPEGRVLRYRSGWPREDVLRVLGRLADIAATGPYPPSGALEQPAQCLGCGYQALCWAAEVSLSGCPTPLALSF